MKKFALSLALTSTLAVPMVGCTTEERVAAGVVGGAAAGQLLGGNTRSTVAGAVIGGTAAVLLERRNDGQCVYRERGTNRRIVAPCQ